MGPIIHSPACSHVGAPLGPRERNWFECVGDSDMSDTLKSGILSVLCGALAFAATTGMVLAGPLSVVGAGKAGDTSAALVVKVHYSRQLLPVHCYRKLLGAKSRELLVRRKVICKTFPPAECALIIGRPAPWGCMICYPAPGGGPRWAAILRATCAASRP
jgi:hypothetical protein